VLNEKVHVLVLSIIELKNARWNIEILRTNLFKLLDFQANSFIVMHLQWMDVMKTGTLLSWCYLFVVLLVPSMFMKSYL